MKGALRTLFAVATCSSLSFAPAAMALLPAQDAPVPFSILDHVNLDLTKQQSVERTRAVKGLRRDLGGDLKLDWQKNGSFSFLRRAEVGRPLIPAFAARYGGSHADAARSFIRDYRGLFGLREAEIDSLTLDRNEIIGETEYARGVHYVSFIQKVDGIRVDHARITFAFHVDSGDLYAVTSNVFGAPAQGDGAYRLEPRQAVSAVLKAANIQGKVLELSHSGERLLAKVRSDQLDGPVSLKKVFLTRGPARFVRGYVAEVWTRKHGLLRVGVDGVEGRHLLTTPLTSSYSYEMSGWEDYPLTEGNNISDPTLLTVEPDGVASPDGWLSPKGSDGYYRTMGPNVITFYDWAGELNDYEYDEAMRSLSAKHTGISDPGTTDEVVTFDYIDQWANEGAPTDYVQLSMVQNFRVMNELHDHYYQLGFTETEGNFQGDDPVLVNVQDGYDIGSRTNANFSTPEDGTSGRMNMYVFEDFGGAERDGAIDRQVFNHELGHGLSHRLVNFGDNMLFGQQSGAFGEGHADVAAFMSEPSWSGDSDWFALAPYVGFDYWIYVARGPATLLVSGFYGDDHLKPMGRLTAYSYDVGDEYKIADTYAQRTLEHFGLLPVAEIGNGSYGNAFFGFHGDWVYWLYPETHSDGEIWASAIWRVKTRVEEYSWSESTEDRLVGLEQTMIMGMQLMPENPSFIQARDALFIYEEMTQSQPATCMMKYEFARTGMGKDAYSGTDGSYGTEDDYDDGMESYPEIVTDFAPWGCVRGVYTATTGDPTMLFSSEAEEVEINRETSLTLLATTPGYDTQATVTGPFIGSVELNSSTDWLDEVISFIPDEEGDGVYTATVTSIKGESKEESLNIRVAVPREISLDEPTVTDLVELEESHHFKTYIVDSDFVVGDGIKFSLKTLDSVDIDLYFNLDSLANIPDAMGYDADEDGIESLELRKTDTGWEVVNAAGTLWELEPEEENFWIYTNVYGFTASNYTFTLSAF